jgi:hypothetical protein
VSIKLTAAMFFAVAFLCLMPLARLSVHAQTNVLDPVCQGFAPNDPKLPSVCAENAKPQTPTNNSVFGPNGLFTKAAGIVSILVGIASVIFIIVGGFRYAMSSGDSNNIKGAKDTILYAIIGLGVALFAQAIIVFVLNKL